MSVPKIFTIYFFFLLYRRSPGTPFLAAVAEQPTEFVLAPQTHGSGYTLLPNQRCPGAPGWTCTTGLRQYLQTLAEQGREAACNHRLPSHTWELPGSDSAGLRQKHARNVSCLKTEDFRFPCLGGRNTPSDSLLHSSLKELLIRVPCE